MKMTLMFHAVGQGLFHSGIIECNNYQFNFVYDCGGIGKYPYIPSTTLKTCVKRYKNYLHDKPIDMLVVSHFHSDHINGIPYLLKNQKVDTIIIPFYTFKERLNILISEYNTDMTNEQISILLNPYKYFLAKDIKRVVVVIHNPDAKGINQNNNTNFYEIESHI